jgi:hypothetical protein
LEMVSYPTKIARMKMVRSVRRSSITQAPFPSIRLPPWRRLRRAAASPH